MIGHPLLDQAARHGVRLGLERMRAFLTVLGEPQLVAPAVHVAGTNGKGSVCATVTRVLVEAGYRVGTTVSPHLEHVNERVQIDGVPVRDAVFTELIEEVDRTRARWATDAGLEGSVLTYFELALATAFLGFARAGVDVLVVEVGLGGRLDATNVVRSVVSAITHIGLDHQEILGGTVERIAAEKAGIFQRQVPVVLGPLVAGAREVAVAHAERLGCPCWAPPALRREHHRDGRVTLSTPVGSIGPVHLGLRGAHQAANAMVTVGIVHRLREAGFEISDDALRRGLESAFIAGRIEAWGPGVVLDGAHNADGARALAAWLAARPRSGRRVLLFGMGTGRDPAEVLGPLAPHVDAVVTTRCAHPRAMEPGELAHAIRGLHAAVSVGGDIEEALPAGLAEADELVVAGSLFVAGAARSLLASGAEGEGSR